MSSVAELDRDVEGLMEQAELRATVHDRTDGALLDQSTALEQAQTRARTRSDYGLELRPGLSDSEASLALRVYLPDRWSKQRLRDQLALVAQSEQLRVAALEWQELIKVYREFCSYRMLRKQCALLGDELAYVEPYLNAADRGVTLNELALSERARMYSVYLGLVNDRDKLKDALLETENRLHLILGHDANLEMLSAMATIEMPSQLEIESLLRTALGKRADYRKMGVNVHAMELAEAAVRTEDGFRFKYIQPSYSVDYEGGGSSWGISTSIILPWGTRNPDIAVYERQRALSMAAMSQQRQLIEDRLRVLLDFANDYYACLAERNRTIKPLLKQLESDIDAMENVPLAQVRDLLSIRGRVLDTALQSAESESRLERMAVDLTEEIGGWE